MTDGGFDPETLDRLRGERRVWIETRRHRGGPAHRTPIWVVVDDAGRVLVRSWRGERGRWYSELRANPIGVLRVAGHAVPFRAELADDSERIEACSRGLREKYASARGSLAEMLLDEVLPTTLELVPDG